MVFTATTDAVQWVQIYGLSRPTDANDDMWAKQAVVARLRATWIMFREGFHYGLKVYKACVLSVLTHGAETKAMKV